MTVNRGRACPLSVVAGATDRTEGNGHGQLCAEVTWGKDIEDKVIAAIDQEIGKIARPKNVWIVPDMPKTRSGKIMRRVIAAVSNFTDVGDVTTLANPEIVDGIRRQVQTAKLAKGDTPRELTDTEKAEIQAFGAET